MVRTTLRTENSVAGARRRDQETQRCADQYAGSKSGSGIPGNVVVRYSGVVPHLGGRAFSLLGQRGFGLGHGGFDLGTQLVQLRAVLVVQSCQEILDVGE